MLPFFPMSKDFTELMIKALDECAAMKRFKLNTNHKSGQTEELKKMIKERDIVNRMHRTT